MHFIYRNYSFVLKRNVDNIIYYYENSLKSHHFYLCIHIFM